MKKNKIATIKRTNIVQNKTNTDYERLEFLGDIVLSLVLLLAMSLMGGSLIVIASSDHQTNKSSDE